MSAPKLRCSLCGRRHPEEQTTLTYGPRSGNYRRASASVDRRVCVGCVQAHLDFVRRAQADGIAYYVNRGEGGAWGFDRAADRLGLDRTGLFVSEYDERMARNKARHVEIVAACNCPRREMGGGARIEDHATDCAAWVIRTSRVIRD